MISSAYRWAGCREAGSGRCSVRMLCDCGRSRANILHCISQAEEKGALANRLQKQVAEVQGHLSLRDAEVDELRAQLEVRPPLVRGSASHRAKCWQAEEA